MLSLLYTFVCVCVRLFVVSSLTWHKHFNASIRNDCIYVYSADICVCESAFGCDNDIESANILIMK